jgi:Holliday junction DNA helicase RuvA
VIAQVTGEVASADAASAVIVVGGLGMRAWCTPATLAELRPGQQATLHTSLVVREDSLTLYGFATAPERDCFELAQTASGVGPKTALGIVSVLGPAGLVKAVRAEDLNALTKVPGIARKGAQKIVIELKDKVLGLAVEVPDDTAAIRASELWREQVVSGLQGLGWSLHDAEKACENVADQVAADPGMGVAEIMRAALQSLARA